MFWGWEYKVIQKILRATLVIFALDSLLEVEEVLTMNPYFSLRSNKRLYAKGIGPVKREMKIYDTQRPATRQSLGDLC